MRQNDHYIELWTAHNLLMEVQTLHSQLPIRGSGGRVEGVSGRFEGSSGRSGGSSGRAGGAERSDWENQRPAWEVSGMVREPKCRA